MTAVENYWGLSKSVVVPPSLLAAFRFFFSSFVALGFLDSLLPFFSFDITISPIKIFIIWLNSVGLEASVA